MQSPGADHPALSLNTKKDCHGCVYGPGFEHTVSCERMFYRTWWECITTGARWKHACNASDYGNE